ncbi:MAG: UvrD-helicase domain-containing protein [Acidimicrobiia bacterium]
MSPSRQDPEIVAEQAYLDAVYDRLEAMKYSASSVAEAYSDVRRGGTHQARLERDIAVDTTNRRLAALDIGDTPLCFGRLDLTDSSRFYVGRLGVDDAEHTPLVVDWRAPVAEPFYRATAVAPMGVVRRRHLLTRHGREVVGVDDEVFDAAAVNDAGLNVMGEGALFAALERERTGRMGDIVATIQAEQDEAVRASLPGPLIVSGGPGTGKTAVALHRAAYLLYTHRRQLGANGVLLVGPSNVFLRYIEQVLPSLGEDEVQLATITGLKPQLGRLRREAPNVAAVKGRVEMAAVLRKALADRQRTPRQDVGFNFDGMRLRIARRDCRRIVERTRQKSGSHNERRPIVERMLLDRLLAQYRNALARTHQQMLAIDDDENHYDAPVARALSRGESPSPEWEREVLGRLRRVPEVRTLLERMWPMLSGQELVHDLFSFRGLIRSAADGFMPRADQLLLERDRSPSAREVPWTDSDAALVDEADALCGPVEAARPRRARRRTDADRAVADIAARTVADLGLGQYMTAADLTARFIEPAATESGIPALRTFGHILIDEAQDLSPMQWRMLARRCPSGSATLVGDFGQASRPGAASGWDDVLSHLTAYDAPRRVDLTVNYRTPAEIMDLANRLLAVAAPEIPPTRSVRETGEQPEFRRVDDLIGEVSMTARDFSGRRGTTAVIAPEELHAAIVDSLSDIGAAASGPDALDARVGVFDALDAKGLEFDHVIVVEPARLVPPDRAGLRTLYVTLTRATQTLRVVHSAPLPEALRA